MGHRDAFTRWLQAERPDLPVTCYQPMALYGGPQIGWEITIGRTTFVYRVPPEHPDIFYVVLIRRAPGPRTLHSPFADLVRLLRLIQGSPAGIRWIRGTVEPTSDRPADALTTDRILAFYQRYLTTVCDGVENGVQWYGGDLTTFSWAREKQKVRTLAAAAPPAAP